MKILLAPSESKIFPTHQASRALEFVFQGGGARGRTLEAYEEWMRQGSEAEILRLWGQKRLELEALGFCQNLAHSPREKAIRLYNGVAFKALEYETLPLEAQEWVDHSTLIFSNLFGIILAKEAIPYYRLKQGSGWEGFETRRYHQAFEAELLEWLGDEVIVDLRAEFYHASFTPLSPTYRPLFYQRGKKVSHYAKHYRGRFLRQLALRGEEALYGRNILEEEGVLLKGISVKQNLHLMEFELLY